MTTISITKKLKPVPVTFSGVLDTAPVAQNGDVMRLLVRLCKDVKTNESLKVRVKILELDRFFDQDGKCVDEGSADDTIGEFVGLLHNSRNRFFFSDMKPSSEINWSKAAPYPWFRITFAGEHDTVKNEADNETSAETFPVVIRNDDEPPESPIYEIGFLMEKEDGTLIGGSGRLVRYFCGIYTYKPILDMFDIRTQLDSVNLLNITSAQISLAPAENDGTFDESSEASAASTSRVYDDTITAYNEKKMKAVERALKEIEKLIERSRNPYFQNIQAVNEYYRKLEEYQRYVQDYQTMRQSNNYRPSDCFTMENTLIRPLVKDLNRLERDVHRYLDSSGTPPRSYVERINKNIAIIARNDSIDTILSNPAVQIMGILPGSGVVTGALKLIQGKHFDGLFDIFGSIVTYGSFLKLSRVARALRKSSGPTVEMLYSYRYRKLVSSITSADVLNKITETSLKQSGTFLGNLFDTVGAFQSLRGHVDSIAILHRNREYILDMTQKAIRGIESGMISNADEYLRFLENLGNINAAGEFFAHLKVLHSTVKGGKDAYAATLLAMDDVKKLLGYRDLPGTTDFDSGIIENTRILFRALGDLDVDMESVLNSQTRKLGGTSEIIEHFNSSLTQYDMFGVNRNADVRYQNTRAEMLLALDEIAEQWRAEKRRREQWIQENRNRYVNKSERWLQIEWARNTKAYSSLPKTLETRIANFIQKLKAQVKLREVLANESTLTHLEGIFKDGIDFQCDAIFDFNDDGFCSHGANLVVRYY